MTEAAKGKIKVALEALVAFLGALVGGLF